MLTKIQCQEIIEMACANGAARADGIETHITGSNIATSRFALNSMTQNQAPDSVTVSVRVQMRGKQARLETSDISVAGIKQVVDDAIRVAALLQKDDDMLPLPDPPAAYVDVPRFNDLTVGMTALDRASRIKNVIAKAKAADLSAAGIYASGFWFEAIGNSNGLFAYHQESTAEFSVTMEKGDASGWCRIHDTDAARVDVAREAARASDLALGSINPSEIAPGKYTAILPPDAVLDLLSYLWHDFAATAHKDKLASLLGKVGQKIFGENITIADDCFHPLQAGSPFDGEGLPRSKVTLVENGVLKNLVYGRRSAKYFGVASTGHNLSEPNPTGEYPMNLVVGGGNTSLAEMIAGTDRGVLLSRVWYVRMVDPAHVLLTGMTRDGTFLIENGKIKGGIKNLRFNVSVLDMLNNVLALGPAVRTAGDEAIPAVIPAMKIADFNFTASARH